ncbi:Pyridoxal phosphate-dependent transferase major region subdomain 1 [Penicillium cf. griseofulvum]|uniref:Pyridoxal phosphate-dependent transferase major region subdomain 1 n=1 Tax=Penicillium cf. griseofulvum TaxID=2972120 RepID=A0A9W9JCN8_9EURO|nr:Pyridoxal phosphate-dependent transferase major region subdomain 1 [Penicillium cf. griseofulvum]
MKSETDQHWYLQPPCYCTISPRQIGDSNLVMNWTLSKLNHEANTSPVGPYNFKGLGLTCKVEVPCSPIRPDSTNKHVPHASNITDPISPIRKIADVVHAHPRVSNNKNHLFLRTRSPNLYGHCLCVDGVALAPHRRVDVKALDVDFYAFSFGTRCMGHIWRNYMPRHAFTARILSLGHFFKPTDTLDLKLNLAIPHIVEYFGSDLSTTWTQMAEHEERLQRILLEFLNSDRRIDVIGEVSASKELRVSVISFVVQGVGSQRLVEVERRSAFGFRSGHMYSHRLLADVCGLDDVEDGVVRVSFLHYNTEAEVRGLVKVLGEVLASL